MDWLNQTSSFQEELPKLKWNVSVELQRAFTLQILNGCVWPGELTDNDLFQILVWDIHLW